MKFAFAFVLLLISSYSVAKGQGQSFTWQFHSPDHYIMLQVKPNRMFVLEDNPIDLQLSYLNTDKCFLPVWQRDFEVTTLGRDNWLNSGIHPSSGSTTLLMTQDSCLLLTYSRQPITTSLDTGSYYISKIDTLGNFLWTQRVQTTKHAALSNPVEAPNGDIAFVVGDTFITDVSTGAQGYENFFYILDQNGATKVKKRIVIDHNPLPIFGLASTPNSDFIFLTEDEANNSYLFSLSGSGSLLWSKRIEAGGILPRLKVNSRGEIFCSMRAARFSSGPGRSGVVKFDNSGAFQFLLSFNSWGYPLDLFVKGDRVYVTFRRSTALLVLDNQGNQLERFVATGSDMIVFSPPLANNDLALMNTLGGVGVYYSQISDYQEPPCYFDSTFTIDITRESLNIENSTLTFSEAPPLRAYKPVVWSGQSKWEANYLCRYNRLLPTDSTLCFGASLQFNLNIPGARYLWSTGDTTASVSLTQSGQYWVEVTTPSQCTFTDTIDVEFLQKVLVDLGPDTIKCPNEPLLLTAGRQGVNFMWFLPNEDTLFGHQVQVYDSGQYRVRVADAGGCVDLDTLHVFHHALPQTHAGPDTAICFGQTVTLSGKGGITYTWQPPDHLDNPLVANPKASPPDSIRYWLITANAQGCRDTDDVFVAVKPPLHAVVPQQISSCTGDSFTITATDAQGGSDPYSFSWLDEQGQVRGTGSSITFSTNDFSNAFIQLKLEDGCTIPFIDTVPITIHPAADASFTATPVEGCQPLTVQFRYTGTSGWEKASFLSGDGQSFNDLPKQYTYLEPGRHQALLHVTSTGGCKEHQVIPIIVHPRPIADFTAEPEQTRITQPQITFRNESREASRYTWHFGDGHSASIAHPTHHYNDTGTFTVLLLAHNDLCTDTATSTVRISDQVRVFMPSAFSPNEDGHNNRFAPHTTAVEHYTLTIYNRWGEQIWQGHQGWDGYSFPGGANLPAPEGVYVYRLKYISDFGETQYLNGSVTLVR